MHSKTLLLRHKFVRDEDACTRQKIRFDMSRLSGKPLDSADLAE